MQNCWECLSITTTSFTIHITHAENLTESNINSRFRVPEVVRS
uniref:Uncharacterized protein n=1 Tax=Arundo donax TaxID=35708 RepID=A0A0A9EAY6_ARUDO